MKQNVNNDVKEDSPVVMPNNVRVNSNREHSPPANLGHLFHDESRGRAFDS